VSNRIPTPNNVNPTGSVQSSWDNPDFSKMMEEANTSGSNIQLNAGPGKKFHYTNGKKNYKHKLLNWIDEHFWKATGSSILILFVILTIGFALGKNTKIVIDRHKLVNSLSNLIFCKIINICSN
jgi:hypothetical protein